MSEAERLKRDLRSSTVSLWTAVNSRVDLFTNDKYERVDGAVFPSYNPKNLRLWSSYWLRHDMSAEPPSRFAQRHFY